MLEAFGATAALVVVGSLAAGWIGTRAVLGYALRADLLDRPGERRLHSRPTPRGGGLAVAAVFVAVAFLLVPAAGTERGTLVALGTTVAVVGTTGWLEDTRGLSIPVRLGAQLAAAVGLLLAVGAPVEADLFGAEVPLGLVGAPLALLWTVWLTNLYNFMDGADGVAGSQAVVAGTAFGAWFAMAGAPAPALLCWSLAAAVAGFLPWNWAPAKIFLGDAGSLAIGFALGGLALVGVIGHDLPWGAFALGLGLFVADATWTLLVRVVRGERWWTSHRDHFYQRVHAAGWSHGRVATAVTLAAAALAGLGTLEAARIGPRWLWPALGAGLLLALAALVRAMERTDRRDDDRSGAVAGGGGRSGADVA